MKKFPLSIVENSNKDLILVDFSWLMYNGYYASNCDSHGGLKKFVERVYILRDSYPDSVIIIVLDSPSGSFRKKIYPTYKDGRTHPDDVFEYQKDAMQIVSLVPNIVFVQKKDWECDDIVYTLVETFKNSSRTIMIYSEDQDFFPMISESVKMFSKIHQGKAVFRVVEDIQEKLGYDPKNMTEVKVICGDLHNKVIGIPNFRKKIAEQIVLCGQENKIPTEDFFTDFSLHTKLPDNVSRAIQNASAKHPEAVKSMSILRQIIPLRIVDGLELIRVSGNKDAFDKHFGDEYED